jgi:hypothetical protein
MRDVQGRIDHLAIDVLGRRIFVAALGNNSLQVIGLKENKRVHSVTGLAEPQRVAYVPSANRVFVANGEDGSVRAFDAVSWKLLKSISYGEDADNLRIDLANGHIWVLYGSGALGEFDPEGTKVAEIKLDAHPESFRLEKNGPRVFVNLPKCRKDRCRGSSSAIRSDVPAKREALSRTIPWRWTSKITGYLWSHDNRRGLSYSTPPTASGSQAFPPTAICDDVFYDERRRRV